MILLEKFNIARPKGKGVWTLEEGIEEANRLGYPVLVRPSYVLGGQGMEITHDEEELIYYLSNAFKKDKKNPILIDKYLMGREIEVDAISDGENILIYKVNIINASSKKDVFFYESPTSTHNDIMGAGECHMPMNMM